MELKGYKEKFIRFMLDCGVLQFGDFVTKSGRKTPFYINTGFYRNGGQLIELGKFYAQAIVENFGTDINILFGPAYKGIPLAVATCMAFKQEYSISVGYCSNRKEIKDHGDKGILLGSPLKDGDRIVIIEDVTTAGTSIAETLPIIRAQSDAEVVGLCVSVDRQERGSLEVSALKEIEGRYGFPTASIVKMREVTEYLQNNEINGKKLIDDKLAEAIENYYGEYGASR